MNGLQELKDALDRLRGWGDSPETSGLTLQVVTDIGTGLAAARKYANLDLKAAWLHYYSGSMKPEGDAYQHFCNAVNIALSITEDTPAQWPCEHGFDAPHVFIPGGGYYPPGTKTTDLTAMPWEVCIGITEATNVGLGGEHMDYGPQEDADAD